MRYHFFDPFRCHTRRETIEFLLIRSKMRVIERVVLFTDERTVEQINGRRDARRREITIDRTEHENSRVEREKEKEKRKKGKRIDVHIHFDELNELLTVRNFNFGLVEIVFCAIEPGDTCIHTVLPTN